MTTSRISAPVLIAAARSPQFREPPPAGGTPNPCWVIVNGPSGTVLAAGTDAPPYPPYRFPTALPVRPVDSPSPMG